MCSSLKGWGRGARRWRGGIGIGGPQRAGAVGIMAGGGWPGRAAHITELHADGLCGADEEENAEEGGKDSDVNGPERVWESIPAMAVVIGGGGYCFRFADWRVEWHLTLFKYGSTQKAMKGSIRF